MKAPPEIPLSGEEKRTKRLSQCPESARGLLTRVYAGNCSPRSAIKAFCMECHGYDRASIADCTAYACPLWNIRPFQKQ